MSWLRKMARRIIFAIILQMVCATGGVVAVRAQEDGARRITLEGRVTDPTGAPVEGATVRAIRRESGTTVAALSDAAGRFEIPGLETGAYRVEVSGEGYATRVEQVELSNGPAGELPTRELNMSLDAATSTEETASMNWISEAQLAGLPLNGRSYSQLATLQSQISDPFGGSASRGTGSGNLTVAGGRSTSNNFLLDGTNVMDSDNRVPRSAAGVQLGSDAILQVQVFSTQYSAEYGRGSGGVLNSISRSGSEQFHGTLFEYLRNSKLDARNFFDPGPEPPPFKRNQFGFTVTGPVRSDTTYFMTSFEWLRDRLTQTAVNFFPDPTARAGFPGADGTPTVPVHPAVVPYLDLYPIPNSGPTDRAGVGENRASQFLPTDESYFTARVDHKISERDGFFVRYTLDDASSHSPQSTHLFNMITESRQQYLTLVESHVFSPRLLGSFRFGYTRPVDRDDLVSFIDIPRELFFTPTAPTFGQISASGITSFGPAPFLPAGKTMNSFQYAGDMIWEQGGQTIKFGVHAHRYRWDVFTSFQQPATWSFGSLESLLGGGADGTARLTVTLPGSDNQRAYRQTLYGFYLQDYVTVRPGLQFNLGLRYEFMTLIKEKDGKSAYLLDPVRDTDTRIGPALGNNPSLLNFSPRIGFSWSPGRGGTVLRGGFGVYYDQMLEYIFEQQKNTVPFYKIVTRSSFNPCQGTDPVACDVFDAVAAAQGQPLLARSFDYNGISNPVVLRYNFAIQKRMSGWDTQAGYVGARGIHLLRGYNINLFPVPQRLEDGTLFFPPFEPGGPDNRTNPAFGDIGFMTSDAQSFYNSFQASVNRSFGSDISWRANYTFSKSVDDNSVIRFFGGQYGLDRTLDRGLSDFDLRHRVATSFFYSPPFGSGKRWLHSGLPGGIFGGWRIGGILSNRSGPPFSPAANVRTEGYLFTASRPNLVAGHSNNPTSGTSAGCGEGDNAIAPGTPLGTREMYFDLCAYSPPPPGTVGNAGRNTLLAPWVFNMDVSLQKVFTIDSTKRVEFRAELFNLLNRTNLNPRNGSRTVFTGSSGRLNRNAARIGGTATTSRQIQFALRFSF